MKIEDINVTQTIAQTRELLKENKTLPPELVALVSVLLTVLEILLTRLNKNSSNSSIPPSQDPNRAKTPKNGENKKKPGGQPGRAGKQLKPLFPDEIIEVPINRTSLPTGHIYKKVGVAKRQVVEFLVSRKVIEYQLEVVEDERGRRFTAQGPEGTSRPIQYGASIKTTASYMSMYQLIPYARVEEYFRDQASIPLSQGTLFNFNKEAYERLEAFERIAKEKLRQSAFLHADETSINVGGKHYWLHGALNDKWTLFMPHKKRGKEALDEMDILPWFQGVVIHDHWLAYFMYDQCSHGLCNAHLLRELQAAVEASPKNTWASSMKDLLLEINETVKQKNGALSEDASKQYREKYREILKLGNEECPPPPEDPNKQKKRGKIKQSKERNLLERMVQYDDEVLRFMDVTHVPFTNNPAENDLRMTKVHQKISGCFRSFEGAQIFCRIRSFLLTAQKHGLNATEALNDLFQGKLPDFSRI